MFKEMRRKNRSLDTEQALEILERGVYGVLSTAGENGYAYGVPVNYVYQNGSIYFHSAREGNKLDNIRYCDKVSFCVVGDAKPIPEKFSCLYESVITFGKAVEVQGAEKEEALLALVQKYSAEYREAGAEYIKRAADKTGVIKITIEHLTGKQNMKK